MPAEDLFVRLRDALEAAGIPYMVTGSFVSAVHGIPRIATAATYCAIPTFSVA